MESIDQLMWIMIGSTIMDHDWINDYQSLDDQRERDYY